MNVSAYYQLPSSISSVKDKTQINLCFVTVLKLQKEKKKGSRGIYDQQFDIQSF